NLVLFAVDASGSMAARQRMRAVKGAVLSLLLDAYQRRDKVGLVTFRGTGAELTLPPTSSVEAAARRLGRPAPGGGAPPRAGPGRGPADGAGPGRDGQRGGGLRGVGPAARPGRTAGGSARRVPAGHG